MQNLPFLVTPNTAAQSATLKNVAMVQSNPISNEPNTSFKEVFSKQVENEATKKCEPQQSKAPQTKSHQNQAQQATKSEQSKPANEKKDVAESAEAEDKDAIDKSLAVEDDKIKVSKSDVELVDADKIASSQEVTSLNGQPVVNVANIPLNIPVKSDATEFDSQKRSQLDASLRSALGQGTKSSLIEDKGSKVLTDISADSTSQSELGADNKWLDSMLPKMHKTAEVSDPLAAKLGSKLGAEAGVQLSDTFANKLKKETINALTAQITTTPTSTQMDIGKIQGASSNYIQASPGKTGWDQAISQKVVWMVGASEQTATLTLNPPDLGPLQVVINVNNDKADTTFISENPEVRRALENGMPVLRGLLDQAGVQLGQTNVNTSQQHQEFQQAGKSNSQQNLNENSISKSTEVPMVTRTVARASNGLVDTFA